MSPQSRLLTGLAAAALLNGCATAPPQTYAVANSRVYPSAKDAVFERVLTVSTRNSMYVTASDKRTGVLTVERAINAPARTGAVYDWADCGLISLIERPVTQLAELNMVVEPAGAGSRVTINTQFSELREDVARNTHRVNCTTTGALERQLLESFAH
jgi:hypothetical protein